MSKNGENIGPTSSATVIDLVRIVAARWPSLLFVKINYH